MHTNQIRGFAVAAIAALALTGCAGSQESQAPSSGAATKQAAATSAPDAEHTADVSYEDQAALDSAQSYVEMGAFSRKSLEKQLAFEKHPVGSVKYAMQHVEVDYAAEAKESLASYKEMGGMSKAELRKQLEFEGFAANDVAAAMSTM